MPKIMHIVSSLDTGGVERRVVGQMLVLQGMNDGLEHCLIALRGGRLADEAHTSLGEAGVPLRVLNKSRGWDVATNRELARAIAAFDPDLVTAYNFVAGFWTRLVTRDRWGGTVVHEGGIRNAGTRWGRLAEKALGLWTRARVFNSQSTRVIWESAIGLSPRHYVVLNGVDVSSTSIQRQPRPLTTLITVGRLVPIKGIDIQLHALARLLERGRKLRLVVVGDGPQRQPLQALADRLGLTQHVDWLGFRHDPETYLARAEIFLCTSYNETFSLTLCEAMAHGLVCVAPRVGGPAEIIRHGIDGLLLTCRVAPPNDLVAQLPSRIADHDTGTIRGPLGLHPNDLVETISGLLDGEHDVLAMSKAARQRVVQDFSRQRYADDLTRCFRTILNFGGRL